MTSFALELLHPAHGTRRVEFVTPKGLTFLVDGTITRGRVGGRVASPEALYFLRYKAMGFHLVPFRAAAEPPPEHAPLLNGAPVTQSGLKHGDVVRWREFQISVVEIQPLRGPERAMVDAARSDDAALQVYADWLETSGATQNAEWARLAISSLGVPERARMNALAVRLGGSFRALVARGSIERCTRSCGQRWESLSLLPDPCRRACAKCGHDVTWCEDNETARDISGPVTLDPATPRTPGDLLPRPIMVG